MKPERVRPAPQVSHRFTFVLLFLLALSARALHLWQIADAPFTTVLMGDSKSYDTWAQTIAAGHWIGTDVFYQAPLYPYVLGVIYAVAGHDVLAVRIVQIVLGSLGVVLIASAATRLLSARAGIIAGVVAALYAPAIFFDGLIQKTALDAFLTSLTLWILSGLMIRPSTWKPWLALGVVLAALSLTRENALALLAVVLVWGLFSPDLPTSGVAIRNAAALMLGAALVLGPVALRNYAVTGGFYLTTSQFGPNLYLGNNPYTDGTAGSLVAGRGSPEYERQDAIDIAEREEGRPLSPAEVSQYWTRRTLDYVRATPGAWLRLMGRKTALLWNRSEAFDTESQESYAEYSTLLRVLGPVTTFGLLVPLACAGIAVTWSDRRRLAILYAIMLVYAASVIVFFIYARYRYPLVPFLILFASAALADGWSWVRARPARQLVPLGATLLAILIFTNWPLLAASDNRAVSEHNLGAALQSEGNLDAAIAHYQRAVIINPSYAPAYSNMGAALFAQGDFTAAAQAYERALAIQPDFADAHFNLGNALLRQGLSAEATVHFRAALASSPQAVDVRTNLGLALLAANQPAEGIAELTETVAMAPRASEPRRLLADALAEHGRRAEAFEQYTALIAIAPTDAASQYALGRFLLEERRFDEAIEHLTVAATQAPSAEHFNDLGIAMATSGHIADAIRQFERALQADSGFAEARRNLAAAQAQLQQR